MQKYSDISLFFVYTNNLRNDLNRNIKLFPDNATLFSEISDPLETVNTLSNS